MTLSLVAVFGVLGVVARYSLSDLPMWQGLSISILLVNALGSFMAGFVYQSKLVFLNSFMPPAVVESVLVAVLVGFLGGFTTFSAFALETIKILQTSQVLIAIANLVSTNILCLIACFLGLKTATYIA